MDGSLLPSINTPEDLKRISPHRLAQLCAEIRAFLIDKVSCTGGHLSSNLGMVEITVALHYVFNSPNDQIVFDVGHQCYTHKILTGRQAQFDFLRQKNGLSGFPSKAESLHDHGVSGHGSNALSTAIGLAQAKKLSGDTGKVIVIIGDGSFTGGMVYEAMNNAEGLDNLVLILNDNKMSISKNDGAVAHYFSRLRTNPKYFKAKKEVKSVLDATPVIGQSAIKSIQNMKTALKQRIYHSTFFEDVGFQYIGPENGHDIARLCELFKWTLTNAGAPTFIHLETVKGKGFSPAEKNPGAFHGVSSFNAENITDPDVSPKDSFSTAFGRALVRLGANDKKIVAITAAMKYGTGLQYFKKAYTERFFDVGMAEEHAVTFAAGLAQGGMQPVLAIYSTFLQRGYDQIIHDLVLPHANVLLAIDRAGLVPGDGETHQGIYDAAYLSQQPDLPVVSPANYSELNYWLCQLLTEYTGPRAIRYPRGEEFGRLASKPCSGEKYDHLVATSNAKIALVSYASETEDSLEAADLLNKEGLATDLFQLVWVNPLAPSLAEKLCRYDIVLFAEEGIQNGGIGEHLAALLLQKGYKGRYVHVALPTRGIDHATVHELKQDFDLTGPQLAEKIKEML